MICCIFCKTKIQNFNLYINTLFYIYDDLQLLFSLKCKKHNGKTVFVTLHLDYLYNIDECVGMPVWKWLILIKIEQWVTKIFYCFLTLS